MHSAGFLRVFRGFFAGFWRGQVIGNKGDDGFRGFFVHTLRAREVKTLGKPFREALEKTRKTIKTRALVSYFPTATADRRAGDQGKNPQNPQNPHRSLWAIISSYGYIKQIYGFIPSHGGRYSAPPPPPGQALKSFRPRPGIGPSRSRFWSATTNHGFATSRRSLTSSSWKRLRFASLAPAPPPEVRAGGAGPLCAGGGYSYDR